MAAKFISHHPSETLERFASLENAHKTLTVSASVSKWRERIFREPTVPKESPGDKATGWKSFAAMLGFVSPACLGSSSRAHLKGAGKICTHSFLRVPLVLWLERRTVGQPSSVLETPPAIAYLTSRRSMVGLCLSRLCVC